MPRGAGNAALASVDSWRGGATAAAAMNVYGPLLWTSVDTLSTDTRSFTITDADSGGARLEIRWPSDDRR